mgnify:CR=1 FL=1
MPATVQIVRLTGAGPTATDITSINTRANAEDTHTTAGTSNPILAPASGLNYSYWVVRRLNATVTPDTAINNVRVFTDGTNGMGTGVGLVVARATDYVQATGSVGVSGTVLSVAEYADLVAEPVNAFTYTVSAPLTLDGSISNPSTGQFGDYVVFQVTVAPTAASGAAPAETLTFRFDET